MQNINQDVHNLQEALKNPNLNPQIKQENETKLNFYNNNLLRSSITASMQNTSSSQIMSSQSDNNNFGQINSMILPQQQQQLQQSSMLTNSAMLNLQQQQMLIQQQQFLSSNSSQSPLTPIQLPQSPYIPYTLQDNISMSPISSSSSSTITNIRPIFSPTASLQGIITNKLTPMPGKEPIISSNNAYVTSNLPPGNFSSSQLQIPGPGNIDNNRPIVAKRKIQELVEQIDPRERLEPEVEDMLLDIADEFITTVATFACRLAKHRKSDTLEVKDLQLHLERNWNIRIPGFASDEIRSVRKPVIASAHQQKLAAVNGARAQSASSSH